MRRALAFSIFGGLFAIAVAGFAIGADFGCTPAVLPSARATAEAVQDFDPSLALVDLPEVPVDQPVDTHTCVGEIRPGAQQSNGCTLSWIMRDQHGALYQTTAGHCTSSVGQNIGARGVGTFGQVVWRVNGGVGNDMALVRINPAMYHLVNPTLCHWGGPVGLGSPANAGTGPTEHDAMLHYGWGVMWSDQETRARAGYINSDSSGIQGSGWFPDGSVRMRGFTDGGDSGSPMMLKSGHAAGVHTHRLDSAPSGYGLKAATRLDMMVPRAEAALGLDLDVVPGQAVDLTGLSVPDMPFPPMLPALPAPMAPPAAPALPGA